MFRVRSSVLLCTLALAGCSSGGGGGGKSSASTVSPFTSWAAVKPNSTVVAAGGSSQFSYTANPVTGVVTAVGYTGQSSNGAAVNLTYGSGSLNLTGVALQAAQGQYISIQAASGDYLGGYGLGPVPSLIYGQSKDKKTEILGINAPAYGWNYQTYGVWITGQGTGAGTAGAVSGGSATPGTSVPTAGSATFVGNALGLYTSGLTYSTVASMTANIDFSKRSIDFTTSGTITSNFNGGGAYYAPGLDLSGTLAYSAGANSFGGAVRSAGGMAGTAAGNFYGPTATEIGGTYALTTSGAAMGGGFGGKR